MHYYVKVSAAVLSCASVDCEHYDDDVDINYSVNRDLLTEKSNFDFRFV